MKHFNDIAHRLISLNSDTLTLLAKRIESGEIVKPETEDEKACFQLLKDLDHVNSKVEGSLTSKKYM